MTDKKFYQDAADEVAGGTLDQSLWIKSCAEVPSASRVEQQAKYIQLRATELAIENTKRRAAAMVREVKPIAAKITKVLVKLALAAVAFTLLIVYPVHFFSQIGEDQAAIRNNQEKFVIPRSVGDMRAMNSGEFNAYLKASGGCSHIGTMKRLPAGPLLYSLVSNASLDEYCESAEAAMTRDD